MDLIYTDARRVDQGVLTAYTFDLSFGANENDFEIVLGSEEAMLEFGAFVYIEGTEYGGIVDAMKTSTDGDTITYTGRTWHGILNSKVIAPDSGDNYYIVSGDAHRVLETLIDRLGLGGLFAVETEDSTVNIASYQFARYCKGYDGINAMLAANKAKLKIAWENRSVRLSVEPIADYTESPVDGDIATLSVERHGKKVNHLVCLGKGELAAREVVHLYVDQFGRIGNQQYYVGVDEVADVYDNTSTDNLRNDGIKKLEELLNIDKAEIAIPENESLLFDIGDIVGASDVKTGVNVAAAVSQKIVKIGNGAVRTEYKTGG